MKMNNNEVIRVLLVDGNEAMREELSQILDSEQGIVVVGEAPSGEAVLAEAKKLCPDVILMFTDSRMPGMTAIDATHAIGEARLPARVIIITENPGQYLVSAIKAGAAGLLSRNITRDELSSAIHKIYRWSLGTISSR